MTTDTESTKALVRTLYREVFTSGKLELIDELVCDTFTFHVDGAAGGTPARRGPEVLAGAVGALHRAFSGLSFAIHDLIAEGDRVAVRWTMTATHTGPFAGHQPTGRVIAQNATVIYRIAGGRLAEAWPITDFAAVTAQLAS